MSTRPSNEPQGYSRAELLGGTPSLLKSGQQDSDFYRDLWGTIRDGRVWTGRLFNRKKDGTHFQEEGSISPVFDQNGEIANFVAVKRDITRLVELEQKLATANKMESLGVLAGGIAHEINSPIQFIGDNLGFLMEVFEDLSKLLTGLTDSEKLPDIEQLHSLAQDMDLADLLEDVPSALADSLQGTQRIAAIVASMRMYSHPGQKMEDLDLNVVVETVATMSKNEWKYVADLSLDLASNLDRIFGNQGQLMQVLLNMLSNASQAFAADSPRGKIEIITRNANGAVVLEVKDDGFGIPPEVLPRVFDQFFTTKDVGEGTGQGLAICSAIVETHGGSITVASEVGEGTCFRIELPRLSPD